jgi:hypothetical protein
MLGLLRISKIRNYTQKQKQHNILKRREQGGGEKFFSAFFSTDNEDRLCKGVLNIPLLQGLSSFIFHSINSLLINHLIINLQAIAGSDCWTQCWTQC